LFSSILKGCRIFEIRKGSSKKKIEVIVFTLELQTSFHLQKSVCDLESLKKVIDLSSSSVKTIIALFELGSTG